MKQWYVAKMKEDFLNMKRGQVVYVREAYFKVPLAVGKVWIIFSSREGTSLRVVEELRSMFVIKNESRISDSVEVAFQKFLRKHPPMKRVLKQKEPNRFKGVAA